MTQEDRREHFKEIWDGFWPSARTVLLLSALAVITAFGADWLMGTPTHPDHRNLVGGNWPRPYGIMAAAVFVFAVVVSVTVDFITQPRKNIGKNY